MTIKQLLLEAAPADVRGTIQVHVARLEPLRRNIMSMLRFRHTKMLCGMCM